jgi:hypothetical protein
MPGDVSFWRSRVLDKQDEDVCGRQDGRHLVMGAGDAAAGVGTFELASMGTSVEMIERTYGHLVTGAHDAFRKRLDSYGKLAETIDSGRSQ